MRRVKTVLSLVLALAIIGSLGIQLVGGQARGLEISTYFTNISIGEEKKVVLTINITNTGLRSENIDMEIITEHLDWNPSYRSRGYRIHSLYLDRRSSTLVNFEAQPPSAAPEGIYNFVLVAATTDGAVQSSLELTVNLLREEVEGGGVKLTTSYPKLRGPSGANFEFMVQIKNEGEEERTFGLLAGVPTGWGISFSPSYEEKQISSISIPAGENRGVQVEVNSPMAAAPGNYTVVVQAGVGVITGTIELQITITGTYDLDIETPPPGLLNIGATAGEESYLSILAINRGSAAIENIAFSSSKPEGWTVTFEPLDLESLSAMTSREVYVTIQPPSDAIPGDYSLTLWGSGDEDSDSISIRVTVSTPTVWGWIGLGIVIVVLLFLLFIFLRFGRR